jgi:ribonuclease-3
MSDPVDSAREQLVARMGLASAPSRLDEALTHPSWANEHRERAPRDNQRLEFLGDGVLDLCVSELLLDAMPEADEGTLSRAYHAVVSTDALARWARDRGVETALRLGRGARKANESQSPKVLADAVEAIVAAVYLDGGLPAARELARDMIAAAQSHAAELHERDPKSALQERAQVGGAPAPVYRVVEVAGAEHERSFVVEVELGGRVIAEGRGRTKKSAEREAASAALARLADEGSR